MKTGSVAILVLMLLWPTAAFSQSKAQTERQFQAWLDSDIRPEARRAGVSRKTLRAAFAGLTLDWSLPDLVPPGTKPPKRRAQSQAEFRAPARYFSENSLQAQARTGRSLAAKWKQTLDRIERKYGVPGAILLAIWARESGFGRAKIPHDAVRILATKAFMSTRPDLFRREFLAALEILDEGRFAPGSLRSSWAGAMGQPQFLPSSYLKYAVDFDGDRRADIWNSVPDTLASIANYLARHGWQKNRDWGFEARIPASVSCAQEGPDRARPIREWAQMGIERVSGRPFPDNEIKREGMMLVPAGRNGPHFVVTPNFYVLKAYNNSDLYALYVGNLADRIAYGSGAFRTAWGKQARMLRSDIAAMQRRLEKRGYDVGGADGLPGFKTRRSIGEWQISEGRRSSCFPTPALIRDVR
ncbi:MAG: lytic murein transglycosylase [Pseudomonadota bacterium]